MKTNKKLSKDLNRPISREIHKWSTKQEKMLHVITDQGDVIQNHNEMLLHRQGWL